METTTKPAVPDSPPQDQRRPNERPRRASDRRLAADFEERLRFEQLLTDISSTFVDVTHEEVDDAIANALGRVAAHLRADLATVMQIVERGERLRHSHEWWAPGLNLQRSFLPSNIAEEAPWVATTVMQGEPLAIERLDDFPPEATAERATAEDWGIRSVLWIPFRIGGEFLGCVALNTLRKETTWQRDVIQRLQLVGQVFGNAIARKKHRQMMDEQLRFERAISKTSADLVDVSAAEVAGRVQEAMERLLKILEFDRAALFRIADDGEQVITMLHREVDGGPPPPTRLATEIVPWQYARVRRGEPFEVLGVEDLPAEAQSDAKIWRRLGLASAVTVPLLEKLPTEYILSFARSRRREAWPKHMVPRLRLVGEMFVNALLRKRDEEERARTLAEVQRLKQRLEAENVYLKQEIELKHRHEGFIGKSPAVKQLLEQVERAAESGATVLLTGETGSGKEIVARAIHNLSDRSDRPLVKVNCAALPPALVEAELFGREEGAYTGAVSRKAGRFEIADGSTILLDEIGELSLEVQAKLLQVIENGEFQRLGGNATIRVAARVIAATNRNLDREVQEGRFREDLFHRLNVFPIHVPPVRERRADIPLLVRSFVQEFNRTMGRKIESIPKKTIKGLQQYDWPGNVREIRNVIERAMIRSKGPSLQIELPTAKPRTVDRDLTLAEAERAHILRALEKTGGRVFGPNGAAKLLDINPKTLHSRMKKLGI